MSKDLKKETKKNSDLFYTNMNLAKTDAALLINGLHFDMDYTDIFSILNSVGYTFFYNIRASSSVCLKWIAHIYNLGTLKSSHRFLTLKDLKSVTIK